MKYLFCLLGVFVAISLSSQQDNEPGLAEEDPDVANKQAKVGKKAEKILEQVFRAVAEDDDEKYSLEAMDSEAEEQEVDVSAQDGQETAKVSQDNARAQSYYRRMMKYYRRNYQVQWRLKRKYKHLYNVYYNKAHWCMHRMTG